METGEVYGGTADTPKLSLTLVAEDLVVLDAAGTVVVARNTLAVAVEDAVLAQSGVGAGAVDADGSQGLRHDVAFLDERVTLEDLQRVPDATATLNEGQLGDAAGAFLRIVHKSGLARGLDANAVGISVTEDGERLGDDEAFLVSSGADADPIVGQGSSDGFRNRRVRALELARRVDDQL